MLGKRIVYSVLRSSGFDLLDYGKSTVDELLARVKDDSIEILLISVLMLSSALHIKDLREKLDHRGGSVKVVVGGAPFGFDEHLWKDVGADAMGRNASEAVEIVTRLVRGGHL